MFYALREISLAYHETERFGEHIDDIMIGAAMIIGDAEGRAMCATDIAEFIGMPRATIVRKLKEYERDGYAAARKEGRRVVYELTTRSEHRAVERVRKIIAAFQRCAHELSKMDG